MYLIAKDMVICITFLTPMKKKKIFTNESKNTRAHKFPPLQPMQIIVQMKITNAMESWI
jgi:hypothetical protein